MLNYKSREGGEKYQLIMNIFLRGRLFLDED